MTATIDQFKALLDEFKKLPRTPQRDPTTLELSGYPHLENVYSNILAFFLDPRREHGFGSLFLESLLSVAEYKEEKIAIRDGKEVEINREEITGTRKRIDLVISTDTLIVGIENKIYHELHNDLDDYGQHLAEKAKERRICKILLGLNLLNDDQELSGFKSITYQEYFAEVLRRIGPAIMGSKDRYLRFALEVIETVKHLTEVSAMDKAMIDFFKEKQEEVEAIVQEVDNLKKDMEKRITALRDILDISGQRPIVYKRSREGYLLNYSLYCSITIEDDFVLVINTYISPEGWNVEIEGDLQRIKNWLDTQKVGYKIWPEHNAFGLNLPSRLPYDASPEEVAAQVKPLLESAMNDDSFPPP